MQIVEYRAVSGVFQNIDPPHPLHPASVSSHRKTPDIGLASYSIISLRSLVFPPAQMARHWRVYKNILYTIYTIIYYNKAYFCNKMVLKIEQF
jgi:hypothetical protein